MTTIVNPNDEAQLAQTIEMFEVIVQAQPQDYQSLEILKEAYTKLGRDKDVVRTSKRIAHAYVEMGQLSSAILEYETILQSHPEDSEVQAALARIETKANNFPVEPTVTEAIPLTPALPPPSKSSSPTSKLPATAQKAPAGEVDDGRRSMQKIFVESKIITSGDFDLCWQTPDLSVEPDAVIDPFIQVLADKQILPVEKSLKLLTDKSRAAYLPLNIYDIDMDLARSFPAVTCRRWCVLPFDRMSKSILVATANPFNQQAAKELADATPSRLLWYIVPPADLIGNLRKAFR